MKILDLFRRKKAQQPVPGAKPTPGVPTVDDLRKLVEGAQAALLRRADQDIETLFGYALAEAKRNATKGESVASVTVSFDNEDIGTYLVQNLNCKLVGHGFNTSIGTKGPDFQRIRFWWSNKR